MMDATLELKVSDGRMSAGSRLLFSESLSDPRESRLQPVRKLADGLLDRLVVVDDDVGKILFFR